VCRYVIVLCVGVCVLRVSSSCTGVVPNVARARAVPCRAPHRCLWVRAQLQLCFDFLNAVQEAEAVRVAVVVVEVVVAAVVVVVVLVVVLVLVMVVAAVADSLWWCWCCWRCWCWR
jgi:hypothetical protein